MRFLKLRVVPEILFMNNYSFSNRVVDQLQKI